MCTISIYLTYDAFCLELTLIPILPQIACDEMLLLVGHLGGYTDVTNFY
jgi:hypothetical protein